MARSVFACNLTELMRLARWQAGEPLAAEKLNAPVDRLNQLAGGVGLPVQLLGDHASRPVVEVLTTVRLRVKSAASQNYLQCREWDGSTEGAYLYVAKPYTLRASLTSRAGVTYSYLAGNVTRTATKGSDSETQIIVPSYYLNDQIWAVRAWPGVSRSGIPLRWLDLNVDGREFKRQVT